MILYDPIIEAVPGMTGSGSKKTSAYDSRKCWPESKEYELILQREMAYELGGEGRPSVNLTCVTTEPRFFGDTDEVVVCGPDLGELKGAAPYARITLLLTTDIESEDETDTEEAFRAIQGMDFVKYHVYPRGYMVRTSGMTSREQVRISKAAVKNGISFRRIGNTFIRHYKEDPNVRRVKMFFITAPDADYDGLAKAAKKVTEITSSLSKILEGMPTECGSCGLKDICDEVEGLRELHFGQKKH